MKPWVDSWNGIHAFVVWSSSPSSDPNHPYSYVWSNGATGNNPGVIRGSYRDSIQGQQTLAWYQANHPDWILYDCDKVTPSLQYSYAAVSLDFTNPAVADYKFAEMVNDPNDAISWDNFSLGNNYPKPGGGYGSYCGVWVNGQWVQKFAGAGSYDTVNDPKFTDGKIQYAKAVREKMHALAKPKLLIVNSGMLTLSHDPARQDAFIDAVDGVLDEGGTSSLDLTPSRGLWLANAQFIEKAQAAGRAVFTINELDRTKSSNGFATDRDLFQWELATYLMSKGRSSGVFIGYNQTTQWFPEYQAPIGTPCAKMTQVGSNPTYIRRHSGGVSIINTNSATVSVPLPSGSYRDLYGVLVPSPVSMPAKSGLVLLETSGVGCGP